MADDAILVTGGAGFVGSHFVRLAHDEGRRVVILDDLSGGPPARLPEEVAFVRGDIGDRALMRRLLDEHRPMAVVHFAGKIQVGESVRTPAAYFDVNLVRTIAMLDELRAGGPSVFVFSSTAAVYGMPDLASIAETTPLAPINPYGASKLAVEHVLAAYGAAYGLRWGALRYFNASGAHPDGTLREAHTPETHLLPLAIDAALGRGPALTVFGDDYATPDGTCVRDYVHVMDLATAHLAAIDALAAGREVGAINLGSGRGASVREVLDSIVRVSGRAVPHALGARRAGDPARLIADATRAGLVLGWRTTHSDLATVIEDALRSRIDVE